MARAEKEAALIELETRIREADSLLVTSYQGLTVEELTELRSKLKGAHSEYKVIKNRLTKKAIERLGMEDFSAFFQGPTGLVFEKGDPVSTCKVLVAFAKDHEKLKVRAGLLDGMLLSARQVMDLSKLPGRSVLLATVLCAMQAPLQQFTMAILAPLVEFRGLLDALRDKKEKETA